jgi:hypothetical protein
MRIEDFKITLEIIGLFVRALGALVFGVGAGWMVVKAFKPEGQGWQLPLAAMLALLATFVLIGHWVAGGATIGFFGLGAGAAVLIWGMSGGRRHKRDEEDED